MRTAAAITKCFTILMLVVRPSQAASLMPHGELRHPPQHTIENDHYSPLPYTYIHEEELPDEFDWRNVSGVNYLTRSLNQHIPQYCGSWYVYEAPVLLFSGVEKIRAFDRQPLLIIAIVIIFPPYGSWAHGTLSSLADRIKIFRLHHREEDRQPVKNDIHFSIQYILNCGGEIAGSCHGGSMTGVFELIKKTGYVPMETCNPYLACSGDSEFGFCPFVDTTCTSYNTCRTCAMKIIPSIHPFSEECSEIDIFPNASIAEYGTIERDDDDDDDEPNQSAKLVHKIKAEIFARGPVAAVINGKALHEYHGGVYTDTTASKVPGHVVSIVGWGKMNDGSTYWICRNSWGQYWGEMSFFRILAGSNVLAIEKKIAWATPGHFTAENFPCHEDGKNCHGIGSSILTAQHYVDPSLDLESVQRRLSALSP